MILDGCKPLEEGSSEDEGSKEGSLLTQRQRTVLEMRIQGLSQQEIADIMGTTRSNISILEKRAHRNITRARRTLQQWMRIQAPISLKVPAGTDLFDLPEMIFAEADKKCIRLPVTSMEIIVKLKASAPLLFHKRNIERDVQIFLSESGELLAQEHMA